MYCNNCGNKITTAGRYCMMCGNDVVVNNSTSESRASNAGPEYNSRENAKIRKLTIIRQHQDMGFKVKIDIYLNNNIVASIADGETLTIDINTGYQSILFKCSLVKTESTLLIVDNTTMAIKFQNTTGQILTEVIEDGENDNHNSIVNYLTPVASGNLVNDTEVHTDAPTGSVKKKNILGNISKRSIYGILLVVILGLICGMVAFISMSYRPENNTDNPSVLFESNGIKVERIKTNQDNSIQKIDPMKYRATTNMIKWHMDFSWANSLNEDGTYNIGFTGGKAVYDLETKFAFETNKDGVYILTFNEDKDVTYTDTKYTIETQGGLGIYSDTPFDLNDVDKTIETVNFKDGKFYEGAYNIYAPSDDNTELERICVVGDAVFVNLRIIDTPYEAYTYEGLLGTTTSIISNVGLKISTPVGVFEDCIEITNLDNGLKDYYAPNVGEILSLDNSISQNCEYEISSVLVYLSNYDNGEDKILTSDSNTPNDLEEPQSLLETAISKEPLDDISSSEYSYYYDWYSDGIYSNCYRETSGRGYLYAKADNSGQLSFYIANTLMATIPLENAYIYEEEYGTHFLYTHDNPEHNTSISFLYNVENNSIIVQDLSDNLFLPDCTGIYEYNGNNWGNWNNTYRRADGMCIVLSMFSSYDKTLSINEKIDNARLSIIIGADCQITIEQDHILYEAIYSGYNITLIVYNNGRLVLNSDGGDLEEYSGEYYLIGSALEQSIPYTEKTYQQLFDNSTNKHGWWTDKTFYCPETGDTLTFSYCILNLSFGHEKHNYDALELYVNGTLYDSLVAFEIFDDCLSYTRVKNGVTKHEECLMDYRYDTTIEYISLKVDGKTIEYYNTIWCSFGNVYESEDGKHTIRAFSDTGSHLTFEIYTPEIASFSELVGVEYCIVLDDTPTDYLVYEAQDGDENISVIAYSDGSLLVKDERGAAVDCSGKYNFVGVVLPN